MSISNLCAPGGFGPGDRVRVNLGLAVGLEGVVVTLLNAIVFWHKDGVQSLSFLHRPGEVCVILARFGKRMAVSLNVGQVKLDPNDEAFGGRTDCRTSE